MRFTPTCSGLQLAYPCQYNDIPLLAFAGAQHSLYNCVCSCVLVEISVSVWSFGLISESLVSLESLAAERKSRRSFSPELYRRLLGTQ